MSRDELIGVGSVGSVVVGGGGGGVMETLTTLFLKTIPFNLDNYYQNNNNETILASNQTNNCSPILFNLGQWSTEKEQPKFEYGLCPDSIITPIFTSLFLACFLGITLVSLMGIIWKRKNGFIQARNPIYMFMTIVAAFIFIGGNGLRFLIGRKVFPCAIYTVLFFVLPPLVGIPTILRCLRLFFMYKLNLQKTKLFEMSNMSKSNQNITTVVDQSVNSQIQSFEMNETQNLSVVENRRGTLEISSSEKQIYGNEDLIHRKSNINDFINGTIEPEKVIEFNAKVIEIKTPPIKIIDGVNDNVVDLSKSHFSNGSSSVENMSQQEFLDSSPRFFKNVDSLFDETVTETDDSDSISDFDTRSTWAYKDLSDMRSEVRKFQIFTFFSSYKFVLILYTIFIFFQLSLWLILGGVEEALFSSSNNIGGERIFLLEGGMFVFDRGCSMSMKMVLIIAGESVLYIVFEIVALILCIRSDRDTWGVKKEAIIIIFFQVISLIAFVVTGLIDPIVTLTDYFIPYGYSLMTFSMSEVFTSVFLPVIYAAVSDYKNLKKNSQFDSELEQALHNKKSFAKILDYARRSYAPESVLCYRDIQRFKKMRASNRRKMANHIVNSYFTIGSPLELNIDNIATRKKEFSEKLNVTNEKLPRNMFNLIQDHCLVDMRDIFDRLKSSDKEIYQMIQDWKLK